MFRATCPQWTPSTLWHRVKPEDWTHARYRHGGGMRGADIDRRGLLRGVVIQACQWRCKCSLSSRQRQCPLRAHCPQVVALKRLRTHSVR